MSGWTGEFENALAWFKAAPEKLTMAVGDAIDAVGESIDSATQAVKENVQAAAEWVWVVIQGDFAADEQSGAQIVTGTIISMIPFVDQICDVRDIVANSVAIYNHDEEKDGSSSWKWFALLLTLLGFIPCVGSFFKGVFKLLFLAVRKAFSNTAGKVGSKLWEIAAPHVDSGIVQVNKFLQRPEVRAYISKHKLDNIYKAIADKIREAAAKVTPGAIMAAFDDLIGKLKGMLAFVKKWSPDAVVRQAENLEKIVNAVRMKADACLAPLFNPLTEFLEKAAQRLDREHELTYRALTNTLNPSNFKRPTLSAEIAAIQKKKPDWVDAVDRPKYPRCQEAPKVVPPHVDIGDNAPRPMHKAYNTFNTLEAGFIEGGEKGTTIYRVLDPASNDNSICWMTEEEFKKLTSKSDWRRRFAVWANWNRNGEVVSYTIPPGERLPVYRGKTASQQLKDANNKAILTADGKKLWLEGGAEQLVINPADLDQRFLNKRKSTHWGYDDLGEKPDLTGVPTLRVNWYRSEPTPDEILTRHGLE